MWRGKEISCTAYASDSCGRPLLVFHVSNCDSANLMAIPVLDWQMVGVEMALLKRITSST